MNMPKQPVSQSPIEAVLNELTIVRFDGGVAVRAHVRVNFYTIAGQLDVHDPALFLDQNESMLLSYLADTFQVTGLSELEFTWSRMPVEFTMNVSGAAAKTFTTVDAQGFAITVTEKLLAAVADGSLAIEVERMLADLV